MRDLFSVPRFQAYSKLSATLKRYVVEAWFRLLGVRLLLYLRPAVTVKTYRQSKPGKKKTSSTAELIYAIKLAAKYCPGASCLVQALAAKAMLASYGHSADLCIGVSQVSGFKAHAWLELENHIILGDIDNLSEYHILQGGVMKA